jgi:hypothetical protein
LLSPKVAGSRRGSQKGLAASRFFTTFLLTSAHFIFVRKPRNDWDCRVWTPLFLPTSIARQLPVSDATGKGFRMQASVAKMSWKP